jgi:outer membrane protein OmpA-like peptidoglycan-associated protein
MRGNWEPYLSLDSAVVSTRARQQWSLPASATLSLRDDTATVSGELPLKSLGLIQYGSLPPGVSDVRVSTARIVLPSHLDSIRSALVAARVLFAPGAPEANAAERAHARALADRFRSLDDSVRAHAGNLGLSIIGRTDPTGTDRTNQALAQWRVEHVTAIFAAAGVRPDAIGGEALATSRPLPAADSSLQARINRSVSFEVFVSTRPRASRER